MENLYTLSKNVVLNWLPTSMLQYIKKLHHAKKLQVFSLEDEPDLKISRYLIDEGDIVLDLGANVGIYTKILSEYVGKEGLVYSLEPVPLTFDILTSNIKKLHLDNVKALNLAVSDKMSTVTMAIPKYAQGGENFYMAHIVQGTGDDINLMRVTVNTVTIDEQFSEIMNRITFVKSDVEGHDVECVKGALDLIKRGNAAWLIEVSGDLDYNGSPAAELFNIMHDHGYSVWWFDGARLKQRSFGEKSTNYFFLKDSHIQKIRNKNPDIMQK